MKTLAKDVTPPGSPTGISQFRPATSMEPAPRIDSGVQTEHACPPSLPGIDYHEEYTKLLSKHRELEQENYEHMELFGDLKQENAALKKEMELTKGLKSYKTAYGLLFDKYHQNKARWAVWTEHYKKKEAERTGMKPNTDAENIPMTPSPTLSPSRPPVLSSDGSPVGSNEPPVEPARRGGLFSNLQAPRTVNFRFEPNDVPELNRTVPDEDLIHSDASSVSTPETQEQDLPQLPQQVQEPISIPNKNVDPDHPTSDLTSSDTGDENEAIPGAKTATAGQQMHPPLHPKTPVSVEREGASWVKPVVIKSEPLSSQNDPGYHLFDQDSLDLDDVGRPALQEQLPPRKRQKADNSERNNKIGKDRNGDENLPHKIRPNIVTEADIRSPPVPRPRVQEPEATPPRKTVPPNGCLGPTPTSSSALRAPLKSSRRAPRSHKGALVHVLEDGADGTKRAGLSGDTPDIQTPVRLDDILFTPPPKPVKLAALSRGAINTRSAPQSKRPESRASAGDIFTTPSNSTFKKQDAATDPLPGKNGKRQPSAAIDYAINPTMNDGVDYAYHEVVRNREARKCLPGCTRTCCREVGKFVEAAGMPLVEKAGPRWRSSSPEQQPANGTGADSKREFLDRYGRHREAFPRRKTPPGFWDSEMPDTQALKKRNEEAHKLDRERVEQRSREAMKGAKGRFVRRF